MLSAWRLGHALVMLGHCAMDESANHITRRALFALGELIDLFALALCDT
jgi:hypothetical protein